MAGDPLTLSWADVLKYAGRSIRQSWTTLLTGTMVISVLSILYPWGGVYHFSESGWDQVMGGSATWSLLAIPTWLLAAALWHLARAPVGRARDVLAEQNASIAALESEISTLRFELERERTAAPVFGQAVVPRTVEDRMIRLADLPSGLWLSQRTFRRCQFLGPATVLFSGGSSRHNRFYGMSARSFVVAANPGDHMADSIVFHDCDIADSEFHNITVIGTGEQIANLKEGISGEDLRQ